MISKTATTLAFLAAIGVTIAVLISNKSDRLEISNGVEPVIPVEQVNLIKKTGVDKEIRAALTDLPPCKGDLSCGCCCGITSIRRQPTKGGIHPIN